MGMTVAEKILARASGQASVSTGDFVVVEATTVVMIDTTFYPSIWRPMLKVAHPERIAIVLDHRVPAPDRTFAKMHQVAREFAAQFGVTRFHDVGGSQGISHVVAAEHAYAVPGTVLVCSDSHTGSAGAFNCAARGVGTADLIHTVATGKTWFQACPTIRYELTGSLKAAVSTKDLFLHLAATYGDHVGHNIEYGGPALASLSMDARRTLTTMGTELNAEFSLVDPDQVLIDYVSERTAAPFEVQPPDADATYVRRNNVNLSDLEPLVARPDAVIRNVSTVSEEAGVAIQQAFIGSCANGNLDDLAVAAAIVKGRKVAPGVRFIVTPGSQAIYRQALLAGHVQALVEAGAVVTNATCGACGGGHMGVLAPGETCITASTRNFKGRMGDPSARIYMASPATVAASALEGRISSPPSFF